MTVFKKTILLFVALAAGLTCSIPRCQASGRAKPNSFVSIKGTRFEVAGHPYYFMGANLWYGMNLGISGKAGDRARLVRELDRLQALGVTNLRVLAGSEGPDSEPWRITPSLQPTPTSLRSALLGGLDYLFEQMGKRGMHAVVCLNNFWPWSGGMSQYLRWFGGERIPYPPPEPGGSWETYQAYTENFYSSERAVAAADLFVRKIVKRYATLPVIMAWELANEPRGVKNVESFNHWIDATSTMIKSLDPNHLVTVGSEGETPWPDKSGLDFLRNHSFKNVDYTTIHIWAQNWSWYDPTSPALTFENAVARMKAYFREHLDKARRLGKPLVVEEFGLARDGGSYDPATTTAYRDRYFAEVFEEIYRAAGNGQPIAGVNFWAWSGEAQPQKPYGGFWRKGLSFIGDPPHEAQGWYSVYATDRTTLEVIRKYADRMSALAH